MDISFPLTGDSSCVGSAGSGGFSSGSSSSGSISVGSGSGISGVGSGGGVGVGGGSSSVGSSSGRGVGGGGSKGGSINNSIEGGGSVVVVFADPPPDIDYDSDSDDKFFDALSNSHCVECQIKYLGSHFDHCDLDSESGQSSNESELDDNGLDEFVEQNTVNKIYSPLSTKRSQSICFWCNIQFLLCRMSNQIFGFSFWSFRIWAIKQWVRVGWQWPWWICWTKHCQQNLQSLINNEIPIHHQTQVQKLYKEYKFIYEVLSYSHS